MTCIVGLETETGVIIGADSAAASGWDTSATRLQKVFSVGEILIGYTDSFRMGQLLQYSLVLDDQQDGQGNLEYLATTFVSAVRKCLADGGFQKTENDQETGGQFLVGYRGHLYVVESDYQVNSYHDGMAAIGCGKDYAMGSLWNSDGAPEVRIMQALQTAGHFSNGVCGPYYCVSI